MNDFGLQRGLVQLSALTVSAAVVAALALGSGCAGWRKGGAAASRPAGAAEGTHAARPPATGGERGGVVAGGAAIFLPADDRAALTPFAVGGTPRADVAVRLGAAPEARAPVWWVAPQVVSGGEPGAPGSPEERMRKWLGSEVAWVAAPGTAAVAPSPPVGGVSFVALPAGAGVSGAAVQIEGQAQPIRWLAPPSGKFDFAAPGGNVPGENRWLHAALSRAASHPWAMWRAQLAVRGEDIVTAGPGDSVAKRLGAQRAAVWGVALQRLARADRDAARRLVIRLGGAVDFGQGVIAPVWTNWPGPLIAGDGLELLLNELLANDLNENEKAARARAWIETLPAGAVWVVDDAGLREGGAGVGSVSTLMLVNLSDAPAAASVSEGGAAGAAPLEMTTIKPMAAARVLVGGGHGEGAGAPARRMDVRIGDWRGQVTVLAGAIRARPPGVTIGPLLRDINMGQIANAAASGVMPEVGPPIGTEAAGMLLRRPAPGSAGGEQWVVYLECLGALGAEASDDDDTVRICFGAPSAPTAVWRVPRRGEAALVRGVAPDVVVERSEEAGRWRLWAPVPSSAIEADGQVRFGLVRTRRLADGSMERTAWPRAMTPWQDEPGRIAVDLKAWGGGVDPVPVKTK